MSKDLKVRKLATVGKGHSGRGVEGTAGAKAPRQKVAGMAMAQQRVKDGFGSSEGKLQDVRSEGWWAGRRVIL